MRAIERKRIFKYDKFTSVFRLLAALTIILLLLVSHRYRFDLAVVFFAYVLFTASLVIFSEFRKKMVFKYEYPVVTFDILVISSIIILTGGSASVYWPFYLVAIISFSVSRGGFSGVIVGLISVACYITAIYYNEGSIKNVPADFLIGIFIVTFLTTLLVSKDKKATMKLANTDALTGAYNFSCFQDRIDRAIERYETTGNPVSLLFIDVDDFKTINDTYGHQRGDDVLKSIGEAILAAVRKNDMVFRYGGDEFSVLLHNASGEMASQVAERIRENVRYSVDALTTFRKVTVSIGIAVLDEASTKKKIFLEIADRALYEAKKQGKNRVSLCTQSVIDR